MVADRLPSGDRWRVVEAVDVSAGRRRLKFLLGDSSPHWATIDIELDSDDLRRRIADLLERDRYLLARPDGPRLQLGDQPPPSFSA